MSIYPWQLSQWQFLSETFAKKKLPHAIILNGQAGLGKFQFATEFAKFVLCADQSKLSVMQACDVCKPCNLVNKESNPDLTVITLEDAKIIKLEQINTLITQTNNKSQYNGFKIAIIYPSEKMNMNAANALLKNLEEPVGASTLFLLVSHQFMQLSATIRSRCQRVNFFVPSLEDVQHWLLAQSVTTDAANFQAAYQLAQGAPLAVQGYLTDSTQVEIKNLMGQLQQLTLNKFTVISEASKKLSKFPIAEFIYCLQLVVINLIKFDAKLNKEKLYDLIDDINQRKKAVESGIQLNTQLVIEDYLIKLKQAGAIPLMDEF